MSKVSILIAFCFFIICLFQGQVVADQHTDELTHWQSIKNSQNPEDFRDFLIQYPDGIFTIYAKKNLEKYEGKVVNQKTHTEVTRQSPTSDDRVKVAIFPFRLLGDANYMQQVLLTDITGVVNKYYCIDITMSYYEVDTIKPVYRLDKDGRFKTNSFVENIGGESINMWDGSSPNGVNIGLMGEEIGIDAVIIGSLRVSNPHSDNYVLDYFRLYMVDVKTAEVIGVFDQSSSTGAAQVLRPVIHKVVRKYATEYCQ